VEDFPLEEIGRITETQLGTVKSRLHYAKKALRKLWEEKMKTPRELLFTRHQSAAPKLDAIRQQVIEQQCRTVRRDITESSIHFITQAWMELVWPCRRIWTGLAVVWVLLAIINISQRDSSPAVMAKTTSTREMVTMFRDQQKMLNELLADRALPVEAERPRTFAPKPRTESNEITIV
jgi:hypothetical protein